MYAGAMQPSLGTVAAEDLHNGHKAAKVETMIDFDQEFSDSVGQPSVDAVEAFIGKEAMLAPDEYVDCIRVDVKEGIISAEIVNGRTDEFTRWSGGVGVVGRLVATIPDWEESPLLVV